MDSNRIYKVIDAELLDTHHYHGSWFEYAWRLKMHDIDGFEVVKELDTWNDYKDLEGKWIEHNGSVFKTVERG